MVRIEGKYNHVKSENLDDYFKAVELRTVLSEEGILKVNTTKSVPYIPRKMMCSTNPTVEFSKSADDKWTITTTTVFRTVVYTFSLGEEYEETMPGTVLKCRSTLEGDTLTTVCVTPGGTEITRKYLFSEDGLTINYKHKATQKEAVRYYKRSS